jgi:hypothetical protein
MFEHFDHTADLGLRIRAADLDALFVEAAQALARRMVKEGGSTVGDRIGLQHAPFGAFGGKCP